MIGKHLCITLRLPFNLDGILGRNFGEYIKNIFPTITCKVYANFMLTSVTSRSLFPSRAQETFQQLYRIINAYIALQYKKLLQHCQHAS